MRVNWSNRNGMSRSDGFTTIGKKGKPVANDHGGGQKVPFSKPIDDRHAKEVFNAQVANDPCRDNCLVKPRLRVIHANPSSGRSQINQVPSVAQPAKAEIRAPEDNTSPKPSSMVQWSKILPEIVKEAESKKLSDEQVLERMKRAIGHLDGPDFWLTDEGQRILAEKYAHGERDPRPSLNIFDYAPGTKASLSPVSPAEGEWFEVELTADTGACDTVVPKSMCPSIPIVPSFQSQHGMEYEVASGEAIPNLGEKRCEMWTEGAAQPKSICMQVADVHKALLSLSRCADMGFESRFGAAFGCLIDTETGEIIPLQRRGNLYVLRAWIRSAPAASPFGRQDGKR